MKAANSWTTYRTRFLVKAKQLTSDLTFTDILGRQHSGSRGDYLVESSEGVLSIAPRQIFEDIYVPLARDNMLLEIPSTYSSNDISRRIPAPCTSGDMSSKIPTTRSPHDTSLKIPACSSSDMRKIPPACTTVEERRFSAASAFPKQHGL